MPPAQCAKPARKSARDGVDDGSPRPHLVHGERAAPSQVGGNVTGPPNPKQTKRSTGPRQDMRKEHGPRRMALPAPSTGTARGARATQTRGGGGGGRREGASTHIHKGHAGKTGRATEPSPRNAQTAWNGVPASEDKGHPDVTARHTQRRKRGAGRGKRGRRNTGHRARPPQTGRERRAHTTEALHPPRQWWRTAPRTSPTARQPPRQPTGVRLVTSQLHGPGSAGNPGNHALRGRRGR